MVDSKILEGRGCMVIYISKTSSRYGEVRPSRKWGEVDGKLSWVYAADVVLGMSRGTGTRLQAVADNECRNVAEPRTSRTRGEGVPNKGSNFWATRSSRSARPDSGGSSVRDQPIHVTVHPELNTAIANPSFMTFSPHGSDCTKHATPSRALVLTTVGDLPHNPCAAPLPRGYLAFRQ